MTCICTNQIADYMRKPKETYRTNQTKQTTSNVFCTSKKRKNPKSSSRKMNTKIFSNYFENYFENFYKYILVHFLFENLDFGKSTRTNSWLKFARPHCYHAPCCQGASSDPFWAARSSAGLHPCHAHTYIYMHFHTHRCIYFRGGRMLDRRLPGWRFCGSEPAKNRGTRDQTGGRQHTRSTGHGSSVVE